MSNLIPQHIAINTGLWSEPKTWLKNEIPTDDSHVLIQKNVVVELARELPAKIATLYIEGQLFFSENKNTHLMVQSIGISKHGGLLIGSIGLPISDNCTAKITFLKPVSIETQVFGGLISLGEVSVHGSEKITYLKTKSLFSGEKMISIHDQVIFGWKVGDRILIPTTSAEYDQNEIRVISEIKNDIIMFDQPLEFDHISPNFNFEIPICNLTRNVIFQSENTKNNSFEYFTHMLLKNNATSLNYLHLLSMGGKHLNGCHAVYINQLGVKNNLITVRGCIVEQSPGWGFVNNRSNVHFEDNITYAVDGAGFVTESGYESGSFINNVAVKSIVNFDIEQESEFDSQGHGFLMKSPKVDLINNFAIGHTKEGILFHGLLKKKINSQIYRIQKFQNNNIFASGIGLGIRWHRRTPAPIDGSDGDLIRDLKIWNVKYCGIRLGYAGGLVFKNITILGNVENPIPISKETKKETIHGKGIVTNANCNNMHFEKIEIAGFTVGIQALPKGFMRIKNAKLNNLENIRILSAQATHNFGGRTIDLSNITNIPIPDNDQIYVKLIKCINREISGVAGSVELEFQSLIDPDIITYEGRRLYFHDQAASAIPFPTPEIPRYMLEPPFIKYVDKTNQELKTKFNIALADDVAPKNAVDIPFNDICALVYKSEDEDTKSYEMTTEEKYAEDIRYMLQNCGLEIFLRILIEWTSSKTGQESEYLKNLNSDLLATQKRYLERYGKQDNLG